MPKSGFDDPIKANNPKKATHSYWQHPQPQYDERSSCFINAGTDYGVGRNSPVGSKGNPTKTAPTLPMDCRKVKTMSLYPNPDVAEIE